MYVLSGVIILATLPQNVLACVEYSKNREHLKCIENKVYMAFNVFNVIIMVPMEYTSWEEFNGYNKWSIQKQVYYSCIDGIL